MARPETTDPDDTGERTPPERASPSTHSDGGAGGGEAFIDPRRSAGGARDSTGAGTAEHATQRHPAPDGGAGGGEAFDDPAQPPTGQPHPDQPTTDAATTEESTDGPTAGEPTDGDLGASDLQDKSREEIRALADEMGLQPYGRPGADGEPRKWSDPETGQQRLRIDEGHVDKTTGEPYNDPKAAVPHVHGYDRNGNKIVDPDDENLHFPLG